MQTVNVYSQIRSSFLVFLQLYSGLIFNYNDILHIMSYADFCTSVFHISDRSAMYIENIFCQYSS
uniref:Uncharacterized protein n=1 Tax=Octopus bimaculoides TaxID=37653 RepID=A0A0L8H3E4_OCTBM